MLAEPLDNARHRRRSGATHRHNQRTAVHRPPERCGTDSDDQADEELATLTTTIRGRDPERQRRARTPELGQPSWLESELKFATTAVGG